MCQNISKSIITNLNIYFSAINDNIDSHQNKQLCPWTCHIAFFNTFAKHFKSMIAQNEFSGSR